MLLVEITLLVGLLATVCECKCSPVYGAEPCAYLPAPPGRTPVCAGAGDTFCEYPVNYPMYHIRYLINKWGYDYASLFSDETRDEYSTYFGQPEYGYGYGYGYGHGHGYGPAPRPHQPPSYSPAGRANHTENLIGYPERRPERRPAAGHSGQASNHIGQASGHYQANGHSLDPSTWWRFARDSRAAPRRYRDVGRNATGSPRTRGKRQSPLSSQSLCQTRSQYIMPRAALNNKGNWMYVVNLQEVDDRFTQLVKSETCASQQCSNLCGLPFGYTSRCEQKYVQKRLVALEGAGQRLYTDVFWFPSCCVCTISGGNI